MIRGGGVCGRYLGGGKGNHVLVETSKRGETPAGFIDLWMIHLHKVSKKKGGREDSAPTTLKALGTITWVFEILSNTKTKSIEGPVLWSRRNQKKNFGTKLQP